MTGRFISVVGPSGVGKDSVMRALADTTADLTLARRVITRPGDAGGEDFDGVTPAEFERRQSSGDFTLSWQAHGLSYGIPRGVHDDLAKGRDVLANLSRAVLADAERRFERTAVILLTATPDILAKRLAARGRETASEIARRLERASFAAPAGIRTDVIDNSGPLDHTVGKIRDLLYPASGAR